MNLPAVFTAGVLVMLTVAGSVAAVAAGGALRDAIMSEKADQEDA